jgi:hypothetical protein
MGFSLYEAVVPIWRQMLGSIAGLLDKAEAYGKEHGIDEADLLGWKLADDMFPFADQVKYSWVHSVLAIEGVRNGKFSPNRDPAPSTIKELKAKVGDAVSALERLTPAEVNALVGKDVRFQVQAYNIDLPFSGEDFLTSFSLPNFFFHVTTAYAILRSKGVAVGKRDYLGAMRMKTPA